MFSKGVHAEPSSAQEFHPEFGYLCPSARFRRKLRNATVTILVGSMIAAGTALALVPQLAPHPPGGGVGDEPVLSAMALPPADKVATDKVAAVTDDVRSTVATLAEPVTERAAPSRPPAACDDLSGSFLAPRCQLGKTGRSHAARTAHPASGRVAAVPIGRVDPGMEAEPQAAASSRAVPAAATAATATAASTAFAASEASPVLPPERGPAPAKKPVRIAHKPAPTRDVASADPPPSHGFDLFSLFHDAPRMTR
jgi:hypothetical protein